MFNAIDVFFAIILLFFSVKCALTGFVAEIMKKMAVVLGILCAFLFSPTIAKLFQGAVQNPFLAQVCAIALIFIIVFPAIHILMQIIGTVLRSVKILASLDKTLGFFFGIIEGFIVIILLLLILYVAELAGITDLCSKSFFFNLIFPRLVPIVTTEFAPLTTNINPTQVL